MTKINYLMIKRLKEEMQKKNLNPKDLSKKACVGRSFVYDILSGKSSNPTTNKIKAIANALEVSMEYIISGTKTAEEMEKLNDNYYASVYTLNNSPENTNDIINNFNMSEKIIYFKKSWIINSLEANSENLRIVRIMDSGMKPTLIKNDLVLIDVSKNIPYPPGIFIIHNSFGLVAKRLETSYSEEGNKNNIIKIISDNDNLSTINLKQSNCIIVGKVIWFSRVI